MKGKSKVVIVSFAFFETTLPLAKSLLELMDVELFALFSDKFLSPANFDIENQAPEPNKLHCAKKLLNNQHPVSRYFNEEIQNIQVAVFGGNPIQSFQFAGNVAKAIRNRNPEIIHFIGDHPYIFLLHRLLRKFHTVHTFHEFAFDRLQDNTKKSLKEKVLNYIQRKRIVTCMKDQSRLIFHSYNVASLFDSVYHYPLTDVVPFGLFEVYRYSSEAEIETAEDFILFFGYVRSYKGAEIFIDAIRQFNEYEPDNTEHFLIAGKNALSVKTIDSPNNLQFIDKFLSDSELSTIIKRCKFVVVPHISASQSGIPNTSFVFAKPIICSDIDGLREIVNPGKNGFLFKAGRSVDLVKKLRLCLSDSKQYLSMTEYIKNNNETILTWKEIAVRTKQIYEQSVSA